jgi:5'-deoxynucleotidase YfbR-like HD superfamily hydrolase
MKSTIITFTGRMVDLTEPKYEDIDIVDIAHALGNLNRFTGHTRRPYSVAEHCCMVSNFASPEHKLEALMHDASEAYLGDVSSPLKSLLPEYKRLEEKWTSVIAARFSLKAEPPKVKILDACARYAELRVLMGHTSSEINYDSPNLQSMIRHLEYAGRPLPATPYTLDRTWAERFLDTFHGLLMTRLQSRSEVEYGVPA